METAVRIVGFGDSVVSEVLDSADSGFIDHIEIPNLSDFSHGEIDWRGRLEGAHWLVLSTSTVLATHGPLLHSRHIHLYENCEHVTSTAIDHP